MDRRNSAPCAIHFIFCCGALNLRTMAKIEEWTKIEDGSIVGYVRTNKVGSDCTFQICSIEYWKHLSDEEAEKLALEALWDSGMIEWGY